MYLKSILLRNVLNMGICASCVVFSMPQLDLKTLSQTFKTRATMLSLTHQHIYQDEP